MREAFGNIWNFEGEAIIAITTNGSVAKGKAVLGRGVARQAGERYAELPFLLASRIGDGGNHVHILYKGLVSFPVEASAWEWPDPRLIARSAQELRELADREGWDLVVVPRPGCGGGCLSWREVRPLLEPFFDDRFLVISSPEA